MTLKFRSDVQGGAFLNENGIEVLKVDAPGNVTFPSGLIKQSLAKRSMFSVYLPGNFGTLTQNLWTPVRLFTEVLDSAGVFDHTATGRFQPRIAGWYQINSGVIISGDAGSVVVASIFKNNVLHRRIGANVANTAIYVTSFFSNGCAIYFNGTTDYIDLRVFTNQSNAAVLGDPNGEYCWMNGYLIEAD